MNNERKYEIAYVLKSGQNITLTIESKELDPRELLIRIVENIKQAKLENAWYHADGLMLGNGGAFRPEEIIAVLLNKIN